MSLFSVFSSFWQELVTFAKYVVNRFFSLAAQNSKAFIELLFWKNVGTVRQMTEGYSEDEWVCVFMRVSSSVYKLYIHKSLLCGCLKIDQTKYLSFLPVIVKLCFLA